jgi:hypothetical protein
MQIPTKRENEKRKKKKRVKEKKTVELLKLVPKHILSPK